MTVTDIPAVGTPEWVEARRTFIGASDAPAVLGLSPWSTPLDVWADKLDIGTRFAGNLSTDMGHALEEMIAQEWLKRNPGHILEETNSTVRHPDLPHVAASADRHVLRSSGTGADTTWDYAQELIECKFVGPNVAWTWREGPPVYVLAQVQMQMACTGAKRVHVCALLYDRGPDWQSWTIERDEAAIAEILVRLDQFWRVNVEGQERPELDDRWRADKTASALERIYAEAEPGKAVRLPHDAAETLDEYRRTRALKKDLEEQLDRLANDLRALLGDATDGFLDDNEKPAVTWRPQNKTTYDTKAILAGKVDGFDADEIATARRVLEAVCRVTSNRVLRVAA